MEENNITFTTQVERVCKSNLNRALREGKFDIQKLFELLELDLNQIARNIEFGAQEKDDTVAMKTITSVASKLWYIYTLMKEN